MTSKKPLREFWEKHHDAKARYKRLTLTMIRQFEEATGIPTSILIQPYETEQGNLDPSPRRLLNGQQTVAATPTIA